MARTLNVARSTLRRFFVERGVVLEVTAADVPPQAKAQMPAGVVFEDVPASVVAREPRGPLPRAQARYSLTGCAAGMCVG